MKHYYTKWELINIRDICYKLKSLIGNKIKTKGDFYLGLMYLQNIVNVRFTHDISTDVVRLCDKISKNSDFDADGYMVSANQAIREFTKEFLFFEKYGQNSLTNQN